MAAILPWLLALLAMGGGFAAAQLRTIEVAAPVLERRNAYIVEGRVLLVEDRVRGQRLLLGQPSIEGLGPASAPARVRISVRSSDPELRPGDLIRARRS